MNKEYYILSAPFHHEELSSVALDTYDKINQMLLDINVSISKSRSAPNGAPPQYIYDAQEYVKLKKDIAYLDALVEFYYSILSILNEKTGSE